MQVNDIVQITLGHALLFGKVINVEGDQIKVNVKNNIYSFHRSKAIKIKKDIVNEKFFR